MSSVESFAEFKENRHTQGAGKCCSKVQGDHWGNQANKSRPLSDYFLAEAKTQLALAFVRLGAFEDAAALYRQSIAVLEMKLGPEHTAVVWKKVILATIYRQAGKYHLAEKYYKQAAPLLEAGVWAGLQTDWERFQLCFNFTSPTSAQWTWNEAAA